jgi:hypothetical protein
MDGRASDRWTRRAFGIAAGGLVESLLELRLAPDAAAKKHKHENPKPKCLRSLTRCHGRETECRKGLQCAGVSWTPSVVCCSFDACKVDKDCCSGRRWEGGSCTS